MAITPPTLILDNETTSGWDQAATDPQVTASFNSAIGDVWVTGVIAEANLGTFAVPTNSGTAQTFTARGNVDTGSACEVRTYTTVVANTLTGQTVSQADSTGSNPKWGFNVVRFSGSDGIGAVPAGGNGSGGPTLNITTTGDNSAIVVFVGDFNAIDGASRTWRTVNGITPTAGNGGELTYFRNASNYTVYVGYYSDAGAAGSKTVGLSAPVGQAYSIVAIEVLGTTAAAGTAAGRAPTPPPVVPFITPGLQPSARPLQLLGDASGAQFPALLETSAGDDAAVVAAAVPVADTATGTDSAVAAAAVPLTETATGTDSAAVAAAVPLADTAAGTDLLVVTVPITLTDTAGASDSLTTTHAIPLPDTAAADDVLTVAVAVPLAETAAGADSLSVQSAALVDSVQAWPAVPVVAVSPRWAAGQLSGDATFPGGSQAVSLTDTAAATDALTAVAAVVLADTAAGDDAATLAGAIPVSDGAGAADSLSAAVGGGIDAFQAVPSIAWMFTSPRGSSTQGIGDTTSVVTMPDTAAAADSLTVAIAPPLTDTATGTDSLTVAATFAVAETATSSDDVAAVAAVPLSESASGADVMLASADTIFDPYQYRSAPPAMAVYPKAAAGQLLGDATTGAVGGASSISMADAASVTDSLAISVTITVADTVAATDVMSPVVGPVLTELVAAADALAITVVLALTESLSGLDELIIGGTRITGNVYPNPDSGAGGNAYPRGSRQIIGSVR